jgi:hypothetical protein
VRDNRAACRSACSDSVALGGGMVIAATAAILDTSVSDNTASCSGFCAAGGGGIGLIGTPTPVIQLTDSRVTGDTASCLGACIAAGGGIGAFGTAEMVLATSRVMENVASCSGTGCLADGGGVVADGQLISVKSEIEKNTVRGSTTRGGGGILLYVGTATLSSTKVKRNHPDNCAPAGSISGCV